jgi:hypothetical protein
MPPLSMTNVMPIAMIPTSVTLSATFAIFWKLRNTLTPVFRLIGETMMLMITRIANPRRFWYLLKIS